LAGNRYLNLGRRPSIWIRLQDLKRVFKEKSVKARPVTNRSTEAGSGTGDVRVAERLATLPVFPFPAMISDAKNQPPPFAMKSEGVKVPAPVSITLN
jgi:hypothetical protein